MSDGHERLSHYRIYREVTIRDAFAHGGDPPPLVQKFIPWGVISAVPSVELVHAVVPSIDNVATRWAVTGEWGASSVERPLAKRLPVRTDAGTLSAPRAEAQLDIQLPEGVTLADLGLPSLEDYREPPRTKSILRSTARTVSIAARAVDNLPPAPATEVRVFFLDDRLHLRWERSEDDRTVGAVTYRGYALPIPGVEHYEILRGVSQDELQPVGEVKAGVIHYIDEEADPGGMDFFYRIDVLDLDNRTPGLPVAPTPPGPVVSVDPAESYPGATVDVDVRVDHAFGVAGGDLTVRFDPDIVTPLQVEPGSLPAGFDMAFVANTDQPGRIRIGLAGRGSPFRRGSLARIRFRTDAAATAGVYFLAIEDASFVDERGGTRLVSVLQPGTLTVRDIAPGLRVHIGDAAGLPGAADLRVDLSLTNAHGLVAGDLTLDYDPAVVVGVQVEPGLLARISDLTLVVNHDTPGSVRIGFVAEGLTEPHGSVATLIIHLAPDAPAGTSPLEIGSVVLLGASVDDILPVASPGGIITVEDPGPGLWVRVGDARAVPATPNVPVELILRNAAGLTGADVAIAYDESVLEFRHALPGDLIDASAIFTADIDAPGNIRIGLASHAIATNIGTLATLVFATRPNAPTGRYVLDITRTEFIDDDIAIVDQARETSGSIRIAPGRFADFNGNGTVDFADLIIFLQIFENPPDDPDLIAQVDLDGDGDLDSEDALLFTQAFDP